MSTVANLAAESVAAVPRVDSPYEPSISAAIASLDFDAVAREFRDQNEFIFIPQFLPDELVARMQEEYRSFSARDVYRVFVPFFRKAGTIPNRQIAERAPLLNALHRSPAMLAFTSRLANARL